MPLGVREMLSEVVLSKLFGLFNSILVGLIYCINTETSQICHLLPTSLSKSFRSCTVSYTTDLSIFASWLFVPGKLDLI